MNALRFVFLVSLLWGVAARAAAAEPPPPLLVVVETGAGAGCDATAVRAAIGAEIRARIVAPKAPPVVALAGPRTDTLLVAIDQDRIVVTLRGRGGQEITRSVVAPADPAERLRMVATLAASVTQDSQTTPLEPAPPPAPSVEAPAPASPPPALAHREDATAAPPSDFARWTFSAVVGAATTFPSPFEAAGAGPTIGPSTISWNPAAQLEAHRHGGPWFVGAAVDLGPRHIHPFGVALVVGRHVRAGRVGAEASVGVGEQAFIDRTYWFDVGPPGYTEETRAAAYARVSCAATYQLTTLLDLLAQVGGHLTATTRSEAGFALASLGLRVKLP